MGGMKKTKQLQRLFRGPRGEKEKKFADFVWAELVCPWWRGGWTIKDPVSLLECERWKKLLVCAECRSCAATASIRQPKPVTIMSFFSCSFYNLVLLSYVFLVFLHFLFFSALAFEFFESYCFLFFLFFFLQRYFSPASQTSSNAFNP